MTGRATVRLSRRRGERTQEMDSVERSGGAPSQRAVSERDVLAATKLYPPGTGSDLVARPRLLERLDAGLERALVLVCAPAG